MNLSLLIPRWRILRASRRIAFGVIRGLYGDNLPLFITVLNGAKPFADSILEHLPGAESIEIRCKSYDGVERKSLEISGLAEPTMRGRFVGRDVLIIEDMVDSGATMQGLIAMLNASGARSVRAVTMLRRYSAPPIPELLDSALTIGSDAFVVGFGLDYNGLYRDLADIHILEKKP